MAPRHTPRRKGEPASVSHGGAWPRVSPPTVHMGHARQGTKLKPPSGDTVSPQQFEEVYGSSDGMFQNFDFD